MSEIPRSEQPEQEPKFEVLEYSDEYKEGIIKLINDVYENEMGQHSKSGRPDLDIIPEMYQKNNGNFWVALDGEKVIGTIALKSNLYPKIYLSVLILCTIKYFMN